MHEGVRIWDVRNEEGVLVRGSWYDMAFMRWRARYRERESLISAKCCAFGVDDCLHHELEKRELQYIIYMYFFIVYFITKQANLELV